MKTADWSWGRVWVILVLYKNPLHKKKLNILDNYIKIYTLNAYFIIRPPHSWAAKSFTTSSFFQSSLLFSFLAITWLTYYYNTILYIFFILYYIISYFTILHYTTFLFILCTILYQTILYIILHYTIYYTLTMIFYTIEMYRVYIICFFSDKRRTNGYRRWTWAGTSCVVKGQSVYWRLWRWVVGPS